MEPRLRTLDRYELRTVLARGAASTVYEGWDSRIARKVAIKTVPLPNAGDAELEEKIGRFKREAQAAGGLQHPSIVGIYDYGETDEIAYIVMEYIDGFSLKTVFDRHERFGVRVILGLMEAVLAGLEYSHKRGIVHRDIKPSNIMLTADGRAKIADFGIARIESSSMTQLGTVMGTPSYMSPEQFMGEIVDARTDIYSSGVVLYQMLTGERPYEGGVATIMHKVLHTEPPKPSQISTLSSPLLDGVVERAMAKRREDRFPSAQAFSEALQAAMDTTVIYRAPMARGSERPRPAAARAAPPPRPAAPAAAPLARSAPGRSPAVRQLPVAGIAIAAAGILVLAGVGGGVVWLTRPAGAPRPIAPSQTVAQADIPKDTQPAPDLTASAPPPPAATQAPPPVSAAPIPPATPPPPIAPVPSTEPTGFSHPAPPSVQPAPAAPAALPLPPPLAPRMTEAALPPVPPLVSRQPRRPRFASTNTPAPPSPVPPAPPSAWIGLHVEPVSAETAARLGMGGPAGLLVTGVDRDGPAAKARLRLSDVVLAFNGTVLTDVESLARAVRQMSVGDAARVEIWRDRRLTALDVTTEPAPTPDLATR